MTANLWTRFAGWLEYLIVTRMVPKRVGPVMRLVFKTPILIYRLGLGGVLAKRIILVGTVGRKTGKLRLTPLEYGYNAQTGAYFLMSGWGGKSDWYRNAMANPCVEIWRGNLRFQGRVEPASDEDVVTQMEEVLAIYPGAVKTWSGYSGVPYDGKRTSLQLMAKSFPSIFVYPVKDGEAPA